MAAYTWNAYEYDRGHRPSGNGKAPLRTIELKPFSTIKLSTVPNYVVKGVLPRNALVVVWGPPKCGKSFWTYDLMMHVAIGREYRGHRIKQGPVVYLALEGGHGFAARIEAWRQRHLGDHRGPVPFYLCDVPVDLIADHGALISAIQSQLGGDVPAAVVIDTLNRSFIGEENKSDDMTKFIRAADVVRVSVGCTVVVIHHCGTAGSRPRGHTSLSGADHAQIAVDRDKESGVINATVEHVKDGEAGGVISCKLERVELGRDDDGDPIVSCVVVPTETAAKEPKLSNANSFALNLLKRLMETDGQPAPADAKLPEGTRVCLAAVWRENFYKTYPGDKPGTKKKALLRATLDLEKRGLIGLFREFVWLGDKGDKRDK
jgi:hypothetical protein